MANLPRLSANWGQITLVGAGPGDPDLITVKGLRAIQSADTILYDALVNPTLLEEAPLRTQKIYVGKRANQHRYPQTEINEMLVHHAKEGKHVVRLKGGDPFVFGRGFEELSVATQHGIPVKVVPGISSCISLAGLQQVPITCRGINESFWVITGTTRSGALSKDIQQATQTSASIVILMGIRKIAQIADLFMTAGKGNRPCMVIQHGSLPQERLVLGTIDNITEQVRVAQIGAPGIILIGEVVSLHPAWHATQNQSLAPAEPISYPTNTFEIPFMSHFSKTA